MLNRHIGDCSGRSGIVEKNCLASKPGSQPPVLLRKEMREHSSWFCRQSSGTILGEEWNLPESRHLLRLCHDFSQLMKTYIPLRTVPPLEGRFIKAAICQGKGCPVFTLKLLLLPDLPLRCFPVWGVLHLAVWLYSRCVSHEFLCQGLAW